MLRIPGQVRKAISHFWSTAKRGRGDKLSKAEYVRWNLKAARALLPIVAVEGAYKWVEADWQVDTEFSGKGMSAEQFGESIFDLADNWIDWLEAEAVVLWLGKLWVLMYTDEGMLRDDSQIVCDERFWNGNFDNSMLGTPPAHVLSPGSSLWTLSCESRHAVSMAKNRDASRTLLIGRGLSFPCRPPLRCASSRGPSKRRSSRDLASPLYCPGAYNRAACRS